MECLGTGVPCEKHYNARIDALEKLLGVYMLEAKARIEVNNKDMDRRLDALNHVKEQQKEMVQRGEYVLAHKMMEKQINDLNEFRAGLKAVASVNSFYVAMGISLLAALVSFATLVLHLKS